MIDRTDPIEVRLNQIERGAQVLRATRRATRRPLDSQEIAELCRLCHEVDAENRKEKGDQL